MKVLITYASAGAGHRRAAEAVYDYLKTNRKELKLEFADILDFTGPFFRFCYDFGYPFLVHYAVWFWAFFFFLTEFRPTRWISRKSALIVNYLSCRKFVQYLEKGNFDYIISTHFLNSELAAGLKLRNKIRAKLITVVTDFGVHPFWVSTGTDLYIAASGLTNDKLLKLGVREEKIRVFGIPFNPDFAKVHDRGQLADKLTIDGKKFTALVMTGSFGSGPLEEIAKCLSGFAQVLVVCAKNNSLFKRLERQNLENVKVFGFVNNAEELMAVSDVIITKPGGSSITELLNMGLFPIFVAAIPGQEQENIKVLAAYGVGFTPKNISQIKDFVMELKNNPQRLESLKKNISQVVRPDACQELANVIR
jgi:processive 1,2-diacylglycerol beta-glucosyltransferase